jgi:hypothetical protein
MKKYLILFFALSLFTLAKAQAPKVDSTTKAKQKFSIGLKVSESLLLIPNDNDGAILNSIDCSLFLQYKSFGIFGGISPVYNTTLISPNKEIVPFINLGIFVELAHFSPTDAIYLYVYDLHASQLHVNYLMKPPGSFNFVFYPYYNQTEDVVMFSPRYRSTSLNKVATIECGIFFGFMHSVVNYNSNASNATSQVYPCFGTNVSLGFNIAPLFAKK